MKIKAEYLLLDAAKAGPQAMEEAKKRCPDHRSLFKETKDPFLLHYAPYLFQPDPETEFLTWLIREGWGKSWAVFIKTQVDFDVLHQHFRKFITVKTESGKVFYFRFYDPRVLRTFLPSCSVEQLAEFFGPVKAYTCEDADPAFIRVYSRINQAELFQQRLPAGEQVVETNPILS